MTICPKCHYENPWSIISVFSRDNPCIACGFDMGGVEFYGEASSTYVQIHCQRRNNDKGN